MKSLGLFGFVSGFAPVLALCASLAVAAGAIAAEECRPPAPHTVSAEMTEAETMANALKEKELKELSALICFELSISRGDDDVALKVEDHFLKHLGITRETKDYKIQVSNFWNKNSDNFICENKVAGTRTPQHFMKRVIDMKLQKDVFYTFLLYDFEEYPIQVNAVEYYNGEPETFLDYLEGILADESNMEKYDFRILKGLKRRLTIKYDAKRASQLPACS